MLTLSVNGQQSLETERLELSVPCIGRWAGPHAKHAALVLVQLPCSCMQLQCVV